jgi:hypothetical protein
MQSPKELSFKIHQKLTRYASMTATGSSCPDLSFSDNSRIPKARMASRSGVMRSPEEFSLKRSSSFFFLSSNFLRFVSILRSFFARYFNIQNYFRSLSHWAFIMDLCVDIINYVSEMIIIMYMSTKYIRTLFNLIRLKLTLL